MVKSILVFCILDLMIVHLTQGQLQPSVYNEEFEARASLLIQQTADNYQPPSPNIGDPEKYYWPKVIARLKMYGAKDSIANYWIDRFSKNDPFHFTLVGMARIMGGFDALALQRNRSLIIKKVFDRTDSYNAWTGRRNRESCGHE